MPRGDRRPGAGAPGGNLNALRSGRHSAQLRLLILALLRSPLVIAALRRIAASQLRRPKQSNKTAITKAVAPLEQGKKTKTI